MHPELVNNLEYSHIKKLLALKGIVPLSIFELNGEWKVNLTDDDLELIKEKFDLQKFYETGYKPIDDILSFISSFPNFNQIRTQNTLKKIVDIDVFVGQCVYINDYRVVGSKPYVNESIEQYNVKAKIFDILESLDIEDIKNFIKYKESI